VDSKKLQQAYYRRTVQNYDNAHTDPLKNGAHDRALDHILLQRSKINFESVLDIGSGTGRAIKYFLNHKINIRGIEPVQEFIELAETKHKINPGVIIRGSGEKLPFEANSFDITTAFGVFHHVPNAVSVLNEMMRVSKKAIFISDANRFAQGPLVSRLLKLAGYKLGLKSIFRFVQTRGKGYWTSDGDGVYYSFSVFDILPQLNQWASKVELVALSSGSDAKMKSLLLQANQILVCAYK